MISREQFSRQASFIAKNAADWAADMLWEDGAAGKEVSQGSVDRFTSMIRDRLSVIERMHDEREEKDG